MIRFVVFLLFISQQAFAFSSLREQSQWFQNLFGNPSSTTKITKTEYNQGETRPKAVLKGVFYFGGTDKKRKLLSSSYKRMLCEDGFSGVYSVYLKVSETVSCDGNKMSYSHIGQANMNQKPGDKVYRLFERIYEIIQSNGDMSALYLHCHYGVHASNTIAQMALMQFCGISKSQAKSNWDKVDLYDSLGAQGTAKQMKKIDNFTPYPEFQISAAQKAVVCF